jgi:phage shock protein E
MKILIALVIVCLVAAVFVFYKKKSVKEYLGLPPGEVVVVDVRTQREYDAGHFSSAINIPHDQVASRLKELEPYRGKHVVVYCRSGNRSAFALSVLKRNGFTNVINAGGYDAIRKFDVK